MKRYIYIIIKLLLLSCLAYSSAAYSGLFRWVDENGNVFYSDNIPPLAVKHGHIELNQRGLRRKNQLSLLQLREVEATRQQRAKDYKAQQQRNKTQKLKRMQDQQLLAIYSTKTELVAVFNSKIKMLKAATKLLKDRHQVLSNRLSKTEIKHEKMKNPAFKQTIAKKIDDMLDGLKIYQQAITENRIELNKLQQRFKTDLKRYDTLMTQKNNPSDHH